MSVPLKDFRGKLTPATDCALEAEARATNRDKSEIVREIMHGWAVRKVHEANVLHKLLQVEGITAADQGIEGNRGENGV